MNKSWWSNVLNLKSDSLSYSYASVQWLITPFLIDFMIKLTYDCFPFVNFNCYANYNNLQEACDNRNYKKPSKWTCVPTLLTEHRQGVYLLENNNTINIRRRTNTFAVLAVFYRLFKVIRFAYTRGALLMRCAKAALMVVGTCSVSLKYCCPRPFIIKWICNLLKRCTRFITATKHQHICIIYTHLIWLRVCGQYTALCF